ncbi:PREDICTED: ribonuclease P protein subunit p14 [Charadrius vociferus]|uniref:ribonuclease P protein subunit p14 n=1 Tax=Charadrius vociferus TaxID=50402 RepID=UPI0005215C9F|nr:PREDICTED: ribonuclease P protein subunit p14 [Charadrius vociferus]
MKIVREACSKILDIARYLVRAPTVSKVGKRVGAALPVDVLTYEEKTLSAILRVISSGLVKLWSALTLLGFYQNRRCAFRVLQTSPFLLALSGNSRELVLD